MLTRQFDVASYPRILKPGHNVWRIERAARAAALVDGAAYFRAVREALLNARRSVLIVGWDIHSQTRLVGESGKADDGFPPLFVDFLCALVERRPELEIRLVLWNFALLYANERELFPRWKLDWNTPRQIRFRLDGAVPLGSSQHQKLIVIDDAVAFSGGLDLTVRRWDTPDHRIDNPARLDPSGRPYRPFHDVQALVDGDAARALARIAHVRWNCAGGESGTAVELGSVDGDPWPESVAPDFRNVGVGIARTQPHYDGQEEVREVERLFLDSIDAAERSIYIENQFLTCSDVAKRLADRVGRNRDLEVLIIAPKRAESWIEMRTMRPGRILFARTLGDAGAYRRVRLLYPEVRDGKQQTDTMVHSKVMIVDDCFVRIGSANLNNRSMGTDTECDLAIEARSEAERSAVSSLRNRLLAEHCGVDEEAVEAELARTGSLIRTAERLSGEGHRLRPIEDGEPDPDELAAYIQSIADPERPIGIDNFNELLDAQLPPPRRAALAKIALAVMALFALTLAWHYTPLSSYAELETVRSTLIDFARAPLGVLAVILIYVVAGLFAFPVTVLIAATAAAFGPELGLAYAAIGSLVSAIVTYALGALLGRKTMRALLGRRLERIRKRIAQRGMIAIAAIRLVPIAPFTLVNLAAGASRIKFADYIVGTALGLAPGLIVLSLLGDQVFQILSAPTPLSVALLVAAIAGWIGMSFGVQYFVSRLRGGTS